MALEVLINFLSGGMWGEFCDFQKKKERKKLNDLIHSIQASKHPVIIIVDDNDKNVLFVVTYYYRYKVPKKKKKVYVSA